MCSAPKAVLKVDRIGRLFGTLTLTDLLPVANLRQASSRASSASPLFLMSSLISEDVGTKLTWRTTYLIRAS